MANQNSLQLPLYEKHWYKHKFKRVMDSFILILLLLLLCYRLTSLVNNYSFHWLIALICESWFTCSWIFTTSTQWSPAHIKTHPDRLSQSVKEMPAVDMFVTTADPVLEPPIITVNTVLSLLALDYPSHKLACYVSDDGCSPLTLYALQQAFHFAKLWVPFCKKHNVKVRAPFRYFTSDHDEVSHQQDSSPEFQQEWLMMKGKYDDLSSRIEEASKTSSSIPRQQVDGEFAIFSNTQRNDHPTIIKVIWENKENLSEGLPHLIYISREKRPKHPHHFKAGAMNVLTRVSGVMTNAPFTLNVDCDMFVNNPKIVQHAMCVLLDPIKGEKEVAFVQFPQKFYGGLKDDPFGNQMVVLFKYLAEGLGGLQGPFYGGTNCFHRRKIIYGLSPDDNVDKGKNMSEKELKQIFGASNELVKAARHALEGTKCSPKDINVSNTLDAANRVAGCGYEYGTGWGDQCGWIYGSITEDVLTGLTIHEKGWRSEFCLDMNPIAFTGCAPVGVPASLTQQKRWATGMVEIFFTKHSPILATLFGKLQFRQFLAYMWILNWGFQPVAEVSYVSLLSYCIITNSNFLPQGWGLWILATLVTVYTVYTLSDYLATGLSIREWWNNHRMSRIYAMTAKFCGFLTIILKFLRISDTVFDITRKDQNHSSDDDGDAGRFTFDESIVFVPGTTILMLQLAAIAIKLLGLQPQIAIHAGNNDNNNVCGLGEMLCSAYVVICYWPFLRGILERGKYGIPLSTICKSASLAFLFVKLCGRTMDG